ncbi:hypothetical protein QL285_053631 [Trifolium repens]|nr:hypothetical protein QL285_053631 [Trifolium repens]
MLNFVFLLRVWVWVEKPEPNGCGRGCQFVTQIDFGFGFGCHPIFRVWVWVVSNPHPWAPVAIPSVEALPANPTEAQRAAFREAKKKDCKTLLYIHQCEDSKVFEKIVDAESSKAAWDTLVKYYDGDPKVKKVKLQSLRRQYELLDMEQKETVSDYFSRLVTLTNQMKNCGYALTNQTIVEKIRPIMIKHNTSMCCLHSSI